MKLSVSIQNFVVCKPTNEVESKPAADSGLGIRSKRNQELTELEVAELSVIAQGHNNLSFAPGDKIYVEPINMKNSRCAVYTVKGASLLFIPIEFVMLHTFDNVEDEDLETAKNLSGRITRSDA